MRISRFVDGKKQHESRSPKNSSTRRAWLGRADLDKSSAVSCVEDLSATSPAFTSDRRIDSVDPFQEDIHNRYSFPDTNRKNPKNLHAQHPADSDELLFMFNLHLLVMIDVDSRRTECVLRLVLQTTKHSYEQCPCVRAGH